MHAETETKVGKLLSDLTTKRAIMVMFSIMISIPLLEPDTYFTNISSYETGLNYLDLSQSSNDTDIHMGFNLSEIGIGAYHEIVDPLYTILVLKVGDTV